MMKHQDIRDSLYDYLAGTLEPQTRAAIETHLLACSECQKDLVLLREALALVPKPEKDPADARSQAFWDAFPLHVDQAIRARHPRRSMGLVRHIGDAVLSFAVMRRGQIALASAAAGLCILALVLYLRPVTSPIAQENRHDTTTSLAASSPQTTTAASEEVQPPPSSIRPSARPTATTVSADRVSDYLRKSKILLIGVANLREDEDSTPDLSAERSVSRALVKEARYLSREPGLNPKAKELIDELNRVLIQLANLSERDDASGIEIVRGGIRQENLLFKIRMAENAIEAARPNPASSKKEGTSL